MPRRPFGQSDEGAVEEVTLAAGDLTVAVLNWGAVIRDVRLAGVDHPLVLGFERFDDYSAKSPFFGALVGRCANRIAGGRFRLDGEAHRVTRNVNGITHLHGGTSGFGSKLWRIEEATDTSVSLALSSPDGDEGYPGAVEATCRYAIEAPGTLVVETTATATRATLVNLAQHSYFNLAGHGDILDHEVRLDADAYLPTDINLIPTGEVRAVGGTAFDFREPRRIRMEEDGVQVGYDNNFVIGMERSGMPRSAVRLTAAGVALDISTTLPGIQFYIGQSMSSVLTGGLDGRTYGPYSGCCFEPQYFPDAINHDAFVSPIVRPGETQRETSRFAFSRA